MKTILIKQMMEGRKTVRLWLWDVLSLRNQQDREEKPRQEPELSKQRSVPASMNEDYVAGHSST